MRQTRQRSFGSGWILSALSSAGLATLIFLSATRLHEAAPPSDPTTGPRTDWAADFPARIDRVTQALTQVPWPLPTPKEEPQGAGALRWVLRHYDLTLPAPADPTDTEHLIEPVRSAARDVSVQVTPVANGARVQIGIDGLLTHTLTLHWLERSRRIAIIIDDLGNDLQVARALAALDIPVTFAVMPFRPFSKQVAELAGLFKREVLVHLPMEADSGQEFGARALLHADADRTIILRNMNDSFAEVPHAVGVNNHMGSRLTSDRERMQWVLEQVKERGMFFIDSRTTPRSVACEVAATIGVRCVVRDLFLDDADDEQAIRAQFATVTQLSRLRPDLVAIGHPRPATLAALQAAIPDLAAAGVEVVPISTIVADQSAPRR